MCDYKFKLPQSSQLFHLGGTVGSGEFDIRHDTEKATGSNYEADVVEDKHFSAFCVICSDELESVVVDLEACPGVAGDATTG